MSLPRSPELQAVLHQAEDIARKTNQSLTSGHVLLALFTVSNQAAVFLTDRNITLDELLGYLETIGDDENDSVLERVFQRGERIARGSSADRLNSLHVLAALVRENDSHAHRLLAESSTDVAGVRATVMSYATGALPLPQSSDDEEEPDETAHVPASRGHLSQEEAPSPISFHPSLGVDADRIEPSESPVPSGDPAPSADDSPANEAAAETSPGLRSGKRRRSRRRTTQVETKAPERDEETPEPPSDEADSSDEASPVDDDYQDDAKDAADSLGARLFGRDSSEDRPTKKPRSNRASKESDDESQRDETSPEEEASEARSPDLAGGRATTMPPSEATRRRRTEDLDPDLAEAYELDEEECPNLKEFGRNITREAVEGRIDRIVGRDQEITKLIDIVGKRRSNNPILVGEPGVGKTAIVEGLARAFVEMASKGKELGERAIIELELGRVLSGTHLRGALSERLLGIKEEVEAADGDIIVFMDEIHGWLDAGGSDGGDAAGELKTAMARGQFPCIGATTNDEFREFVEADPAFERRFQVVLVDEPDSETALEIAQGIQPHYEDHHDVAYTDEALTAAVRMSRRYIHDRRLPDKAIGVLDLAGSRAARKENDNVGRRQIVEVVAESAGLPVDRLTQDNRKRFLEIEEHIDDKIVGQRHVIETVAEVLRRNYAGFRGNRPIGSLLFLGPTGVGKTETVKVLADFLFHDREAVVQVDMSEYMKSHSVSRFVGAPPGYVGHDRGGQLTEAIRRRPYQIVLLDEVEKAHRDVLNVLLQLFEEGTVTDGKGRAVDFSNTLVIMTSNLGAEVFDNHRETQRSERIGFGAKSRDSSTSQESHDQLTEDALTAAKEHFTPELWNRMDEKLVFTPLSRDEIGQIARIQLQKSADRIREESEIELEFGRGVIDHLIDNGGYDPELGARPMRQTIQRVVEGTVAREVLQGTIARGDTVRVVRRNGEITCATEETPQSR